MSKTKVIRRLFAAPTFEACQLIRKFMYSDSHTERYLCLTTTSSKIREWSEELESLTKIVEQDPTNSRNLFELAGKYLGIGKFNLLPDPINQEYLENAYQHSLQLLELEPNNLEALKLAAKAAVLTNRYETAIRILRSTDYTETSSFSYWFWLLECYFHVGDIRSVLAICEKFKTRELECPVKFRPHIHFWLRYVKNHYYHQTAS